MSEPAAPLSGGRRRLSPDSKTGGACEGIAASRSGLAERRTLIPGRRRPSIPAGRASVPMESRGRAWGVSPGLSGEAESANPSSVSPRIIPFPAVSPKRSAAETWAGTRTIIRRLLPVEPLGGVSSQRLGPESRSASADSPGSARSPFPSSVSPTSVGSDGRRQGRAGSQGQRTALITVFFSSDQQAVRLTRRPEATRSRPSEPERVVPRSGARSSGDSQRCPSPPPRCPEAGADCLRTARRAARARTNTRRPPVAEATPGVR